MGFQASSSATQLAFLLISSKTDDGTSTAKVGILDWSIVFLSSSPNSNAILDDREMLFSSITALLRDVCVLTSIQEDLLRLLTLLLSISREDELNISRISRLFRRISARMAIDDGGYTGRRGIETLLISDLLVQIGDEFLLRH